MDPLGTVHCDPFNYGNEDEQEITSLENSGLDEYCSMSLSEFLRIYKAGWDAFKGYLQDKGKYPINPFKRGCVQYNAFEDGIDDCQIEFNPDKELSEYLKWFPKKGDETFNTPYLVAYRDGIPVAKIKR